MAFVASADVAELQKQTGPVDDMDVLVPSVVAWLYSVAVAAPTTGVELPGQAVPWVCLRLVIARFTNPLYLREVCSVVGMLCAATGSKASALPAFTIGAKSPALLPAAALSDAAAACVAGDERACSYLVYQLHLGAVSTLVAGSRPAVGRPATNAGSAYTLLWPILLKYADECLFPLTGDQYLHQVIGFHIPSWARQLQPGGAYAALYALYGSAANNIARPYMDAAISDLMAPSAAGEILDDVVLFVVLTTLVAELGTNAHAAPVCNEQLVSAWRRPDRVPRPFVLCDFPVAQIETDAYGYVDFATNQLVVGNGLGVAATFDAWISACASAGCLATVTSFVQGTAGATNPLMKYTSGGVMASTDD